MELPHDTKADALYIRLSDKHFALTKSLDDRRHVNYAQDGSPIGIEVLYPSLGVNVDELPFEAAIGRLLEEHGFKVVSALMTGYGAVKPVSAPEDFKKIRDEIEQTIAEEVDAEA